MEVLLVVDHIFSRQKYHKVNPTIAKNKETARYTGAPDMHLVTTSTGQATITNDHKDRLAKPQHIPLNHLARGANQKQGRKGQDQTLTQLIEARKKVVSFTKRNSSIRYSE
jgi:hypothetical protein